MTCEVLARVGTAAPRMVSSGVVGARSEAMTPSLFLPPRSRSSERGAVGCDRTHSTTTHRDRRIAGLDPLPPGHPISWGAISSERYPPRPKWWGVS